MVDKNFIGLSKPDITRFESYLPTAFSSELSLLQKVNKIIQDLNRSFDLSNEIVDYLNRFIEAFDEKLYVTIEDVLKEWLDNGKLADIVRVAINDEVIQARKTPEKIYNSLVERLDGESETLKQLIKENEMLIKNIISEIDDVNNRVLNGRLTSDIRSIFSEPINEMSSFISNLPSENFNFGFISDTHYQQGGTYWGEGGKVGQTETSLSHLMNIGYFSTSLNFVMCGGDNIDCANPYSKYSAYNMNNQFVSNALKYIHKPVFFGKGNHDDNNIVDFYSDTEPYKTYIKNQSDIVLTDSDFSKLYYQKEQLFGEKRHNDSNYMYVDFDEHKIRMIWVDTYDNPMTLKGNKLEFPKNQYSMISETQLKWMASSAFNVESGWKIIIGTHCPLDGVFMNNTNICVNHDKMVDLIECFKNNKPFMLNGVSYNFKSSEIVMVISGHYHMDNYKKLKGVNYVVADCSQGGAKPTKYFDTKNEDSWKFCSINTSNKNVKVQSFGRGVDYEFTY